MQNIKVGDKVKILKYWEGEGIVRKIYSDSYEVKMISGPQTNLGAGDLRGVGGFLFDEVELIHTSMKIVSVKRSTENVGLKVYGKVLGESGNTYNFGYIRRKGFRGWICSCEDFFFNRAGKNQNCKHLHFVRGQVGRYASSVRGNQ